MISEESGVKKFGAKPEECFVTVDPIDGSTNFMHGLPFYACSIAVSEKPNLNDVYAGMVADLVHDVTYTAFKGEGAYRDGKKIETSKNVSLEEAVIGLDLKHLQSQRTGTKTNSTYCKNKTYPPFRRQRT